MQYTWQDYVWAGVGGFILCAGAALIMAKISAWYDTRLDRAARSEDDEA